jgi:hypothetical protein
LLGIKEEMKCPHCLVAFHVRRESFQLGLDATSSWAISKTLCPTCGKYIFELVESTSKVGGEYHSKRKRLIYPQAIARTPLSTHVPEEFSADYKEACITLPDSPKASAALSRRCLQHLLRENAGAKQRDLVKQIQQVLDSGQLPSYLSGSLDAVRNIGNFAAHPAKSTSTGEIVEVEPGEAEWNLDVLEALFDFYFVQPKLIEVKKAALNEKLKDAEKPEMK